MAFFGMFFTFTRGSLFAFACSIPIIAFYYKKRLEGYDQLLSGGRVVIKDNVGIGALCTIDRGVTGDTTIGEGTKISVN